MQVGKLPTDKLKELLSHRLGVLRDDVLVRPGIGEDCAVVDFGDEVCILSTDPITGAEKGLGWLAVHISCNDVASSGGQPIGVQLALLLPESATETLPAEIMADAHRACEELEIAILGGHTEVVSIVSKPIVVTTAIGRCPKTRYVTSKGQRPGDAVLVTKALGLEGTAILASDFPHLLSRLPLQVLDTARSYAKEISVVKEALSARDAGVSAMHDITEGGLYGAAVELTEASGYGMRLNSAQAPVRPETRQICAELGLDPLGLISSGSLIITTPEPEAVIQAVALAGSEAVVIGQVVEEKTVVISEPSGELRELSGYSEDELWRFVKSC